MQTGNQEEQQCQSAEAVLHQAYQCTRHKECKYAKAKRFAEGDSFDKIVNTMDSAAV